MIKVEIKNRNKKGSLTLTYREDEDGVFELMDCFRQSGDWTGYMYDDGNVMQFPLRGSEYITATR